MGIRGIAKRAAKSVKDYGDRVVDQGRTLANTPGTEAQRFADSPGGFSAYLPKPARTAVGVFLPKPREVVNAYRKDGASGFAAQAKVNIQIATAPIGGAALAKGAGALTRGTAAFARAPKVAGILRAANSELGAARIPGGRLRTAADLAMTRGVRAKSTPGANIAAATARLEATASRVASGLGGHVGTPSGNWLAASTKPAAQVVTRSGSTIGSRAASLPGRAVGAIAREAYGKPFQNVIQAASRIKGASGIGGRVRATAAAVGHTPGFALRVGSITVPTTAALAGAALETKNQIQESTQGNTAYAGRTSGEKGLLALADAYAKSNNKAAFQEAILEGFKHAELKGIRKVEGGMLERLQADKSNKKLLRESVKNQYKRATSKY